MSESRRLPVLQDLPVQIKIVEEIRRLDWVHGFVFFLVGWVWGWVDVGLFLCFFLSFVCLIVGICGMQILVDDKTRGKLVCKPF